MPRWRVVVETAAFVMSSQMDEMALVSVSEGIRTLAEERADVDVEGVGPEGFVRATFELNALTAGAAVVECEAVVTAALLLAAEIDAIPGDSATVARVRVARAPVGDEWTAD